MMNLGFRNIFSHRNNQVNEHSNESSLTTLKSIIFREQIKLSKLISINIAIAGDVKKKIKDKFIHRLCINTYDQDQTDAERRRNNLNNNFHHARASSFNDFSSKIKIQRHNYNLNVYDILSRDEWSSMRIGTYSIATSIILCFSCQKKSSFENLYRWIDEILQNGKNSNLILVGLESNLWEEGNSEHVSCTDIQKFCYTYHFTAFIPCSDTNDKSIDEIFQACALKFQSREKKPKKRTIFSFHW